MKYLRKMGDTYKLRRDASLEDAFEEARGIFMRSGNPVKIDFNGVIVIMEDTLRQYKSLVRLPNGTFKIVITADLKTHLQDAQEIACLTGMAVSFKYQGRTFIVAKDSNIMETIKAFFACTGSLPSTYAIGP